MLVSVAASPFQYIYDLQNIIYPFSPHDEAVRVCAFYGIVFGG
jgi:hypothetical protein